MAERINTLVISATGSQRFAVFARYRRKMPWHQVDSCETEEKAEVEADRLETHSKLRCDTIDQWMEEKWGDDAPLVPPPI